MRKFPPRKVGYIEGIGRVEAPSLPLDEWLARTEKLVGRPLSAAENKRVRKMAENNWTCRVAAEDILGRDLTHEEILDRNC